MREDGTRDSYALMPIGPKYDLWWSYENPQQDSFLESWIELGEDFYESIIASTVPILLEHVKALRGSPLAIDFYVWVSYRIYLLKHQNAGTLRLPVPVLKAELGSSFSRSRDFLSHMNRAIDKVKTVFPHLDCSLTNNGFSLASVTQIPELFFAVWYHSSEAAIEAAENQPTLRVAWSNLPIPLFAFGVSLYGHGRSFGDNGKHFSA